MFLVPATAGAAAGGGFDTTTRPFEMMTAAEGEEATSCVAALAARA